MDKKGDTDFSDDEVFFGMLSLKEVKKIILMDIHQKNKSRMISCDAKSSDDIKIIEQSSQPNISLLSHTDGITVDNLKSISDPHFDRNRHVPQKLYTPEHECQDSFLEIEKNVAEQCMSMNKSENNLDNTLDIVDFILNNAQTHTTEKNVKVNKPVNQIVCNDNTYDHYVPKDILSQPATPKDENSHNDYIQKCVVNTPSIPTPIMPIKIEKLEHENILKTNNSKSGKVSVTNTPMKNKQDGLNLFKTPEIPRSGRKETCTKKTSSKLKTYEHIMSPIATYIRNSPQVPLVTDVHPKKPLPNKSSIPKLLMSASEKKISNKENVVLPKLAYRSAKKTTVIDLNKEKLPQSQWAQKLTPSAQKPVVLKHNHRVTVPQPSPSQQENSFADLPLHQAEVSVCTQKLAFHKL